MSVTILSSKGQVILPKLIRESGGLKPGTRFSVEETAEGILLRPLKHFPVTRHQDVFGCLRPRGNAKTIEEMNAGVLAEAMRRHAHS